MDERPPPNSRAELERLLDLAVDAPERHAEVLAEITARFGQQKAVLIGDVDSFTEVAERVGILACLVVLRQLQRLARPVVVAHGGTLLKSEADTLFCLFDTVAAALDAALAINHRLARLRPQLPEADHFRSLTLAVGIGWGPVLNVGDEDVYGAEVNYAYKLGEDVGRGGDILLTAAARAQLAGRDLPGEERRVALSGVTLTYFAVDPAARDGE